jgi:hypothetical protein
MMLIQYGGKMTELRVVGAISVALPSVEFHIAGVAFRKRTISGRVCGTKLWNRATKDCFRRPLPSDERGEPRDDGEWKV